MSRERTPSIAGQRFGRLVVQWDDGYVVEFECDCGRRKVVKRGNVIHGHTTSCGCYRKEKARATAESNQGKKYNIRKIPLNDPTKI